jgi:hypothetical protein
VGGVEHLVVLLVRPVRRLQERPDVVEQVRCEHSTGCGVDLRRLSCGGHDGEILQAALAATVREVTFA